MRAARKSGKMEWGYEIEDGPTIKAGRSPRGGPHRRLPSFLGPGWVKGYKSSRGDVHRETWVTTRKIPALSEHGPCLAPVVCFQIAALGKTYLKRVKVKNRKRLFI